MEYLSNPTLELAVEKSTWHVAEPLYYIWQVQQISPMYRSGMDGFNEILWGVQHLLRRFRARTLDREELARLRDILRSANPDSIKIDAQENIVLVRYQRY